MTYAQFVELQKELKVQEYVFTTKIIEGDNLFYAIECLREMIPASVIKLLLNAPDLNGISRSSRGTITFTYKGV